MTLHPQQQEEFNCPKCKITYIPYEDGLPCPSCNMIPENVPEDNFFLIEDIISSLLFNQTKYGRYTPEAWLVHSLEDHVTQIVFTALDRIVAEKPEDIVLFVDEYLDNMKWGDESYLKKYYREMIIKVWSRRQEMRPKFWKKVLSRIIG